MNQVFAVIIVICCICAWNRHKKSNVASQSKKEIRNNCIRCVRNGKMEYIATFESGKIYLVPYGGVIGYYDNAGNVYNDNEKKIGYIRDYKMYMSREFLYDDLVKMFPNSSLKKPNDLICFLGEVLGTTHGSIYENDRCEAETAYFDLNNESLLGAGAAYIALVYEGIIPSEKKSYYNLRYNDCL